MKFEEIQKLWTSDCNIDETELAQESVKIPQLHNKYLIFYSNEKLRLKTQRFEHSKLVKLKKEYYGGKMSQEELEAIDWEPFQHKLLKADVEQYVDADENVIESKKMLALQEEKVDYLEAIVKGLSTRGYLIKNAIDWKRFTEGH
ncbi:recombination mediator protein UvsY [Marine Group I thaumarchaeote]|uniref:Recombination mediator protein UvsY n=2 Tax=Marine Group I thaumarchaeote TaxID=2511932 RepID=A0A7K4MWS7_9ARCH|nr:recombination mediator protein UvsY [Marine Group I thaumarchaeote]